MTKFLPAAAAALTLALVPLAASAGPGNGHGNGHSNGHGNGHRPASVDENGDFCPPGLARREPACVPPGQARHGLTDAERADRQEERRAERRAEEERAVEEAEADAREDAERIAAARAERRAALEANLDAERQEAARAEAEARELDAERIAAARAERRAAQEAESRSASADERDSQPDDDLARAAQVLTALLVPQGQVAGTTPLAGVAPPQQQVAPTPAPVAPTGGLDLTQALARAATAGTVGY